MQGRGQWLKDMEDYMHNDDIIMNEDVPADRLKLFEVITADENSCNALMNFWIETKRAMDWNDCHEPTLEILPCDDPLKGLRGYLVAISVSHVYDADNDDVSMVFSWRFAEPISRIVNINVEDHNPSEVMIRVIDERWQKCDDPKRLMVGFLNYDKSECMYFPISIIKGMNDEAKMKYQQTISNA